MKKDLRKILENGKEYMCTRNKDGLVRLFYYENGKCNVYEFYDKKHNGWLSKLEWFEMTDYMFLEITSIDIVCFDGSISFTGKIIYD